MHRVLLMILALGPGVALGQERPPVQQSQRPALNPAGYVCRAQGRYFDRGETACVPTPEGGRVAECGMAINMMSWSISDRPCQEP
jgi:hypothetical protein